MDDGPSMLKESRNIYIRGNSLIRNFRNCTDQVKVALFKTYCSSVFCCSLWASFKCSQLNTVCVALNKVFKYFMCKRRDYSASFLFVTHGVNNMKVIQRKMAYSLRCRIESSCNCIIQSIVNSCYYKKSTMYNMWNTILYMPTNHVWIIFDVQLLCNYFSSMD